MRGKSSNKRVIISQIVQIIDGKCASTPTTMMKTNILIIARCSGIMNKTKPNAKTKPIRWMGEFLLDARAMFGGSSGSSSGGGSMAMSFWRVTPYFFASAK
mmetsp:Transcript_23748/g.38110  ORF Transcript_23748/g.38110 Transcript_23748/m.38110 type:complete len:101 (+) Transcript_23748:218-520(+)